MITKPDKTLALQYSIIDAFSSSPFYGNPAAVVILPQPDYLDDETMQLLAREFNLPDTAFVYPLEGTSEDKDGHARFGLRWFTPATEVVICGHATLAAGAVIFHDPHRQLGTPPSSIKFETHSSGTLSAFRLEDGRIELEFPAAELKEMEESERVGVVTSVFERAFKLERAGGRISYIGVGAEKPYEGYLFVEVEGDGLDLKVLDVDASALLDIPNVKVVTITQRGASPNEHFTSRTFAPANGVPEDPVCGSAHCLLGPYWSNKLGIPDGQEVIGKQVSQRTGIVGVIWDKERHVCKLRGNAALAATGEMYVES